MTFPKVIREKSVIGSLKFPNNPLFHVWCTTSKFDIFCAGDEKKILLISILVFCTKIKSLCQIVGRQVLRFEVTGGVVSTGCW